MAETGSREGRGLGAPVALALLAGAPALVYEVVWTRQVALLVGSQVEAISAVLVAFFGGLALGAFALGPLADRVRRPLRLYAALEGGAALVALATTTALDPGRSPVDLTGAPFAVVAGLLDSVDDTQAAVVTGGDSVLGLGPDEDWSAPSLAALTAVVSTIGPWLPRWMRRVGWVVVLCVALVHTITTPTSFGALIALLVGWVVGTAVTVVSGSPSHRPTGASIAAGLAAVGRPLAGETGSLQMSAFCLRIAKVSVLPSGDGAP